MHNSDPSAGVGRTSLGYARFNKAATLAGLLLLVGLALAPSAALAAEGASLPGPTWAWIAAAVLQGLISLVVGAVTVVLRENLITERVNRQRLEDRLNDTRESYATQHQLTQAQAKMAEANAQLLQDVRREIDTRLKPIEKDVSTLQADVAGMVKTVERLSAQNVRILDILDPKGA